MRYCTSKWMSTMFSSSVSISASLTRSARPRAPTSTVRSASTSTSSLDWTGQGMRQRNPDCVVSV
jgi:hypothetical protein